MVHAGDIQQWRLAEKANGPQGHDAYSQDLDLSPQGCRLVFRSRVACARCRDSGFTTYKHPRVYPVAECSFCECKAGQAARLRWDRNSLTAQTLLLNRAGVPLEYHSARLAEIKRWGADLVQRRQDPKKLPAINAILKLYHDRLIVDVNGQELHSVKLDGPYGVGKTYLASAYINELVLTGLQALWFTYDHLVRFVQAGYGDDTAEDRLRELETVPYLLIDDLGRADITTPEKEDRVRIVEMVLNARLNHRRTTVVTTNLDDDQLQERFSPRLLERFKMRYACLTMSGRNMREEL